GEAARAPVRIYSPHAAIIILPLCGGTGICLARIGHESAYGDRRTCYNNIGRYKNYPSSPALGQGWQSMRTAHSCSQRLIWPTSPQFKCHTKTMTKRGALSPVSRTSTKKAS